jgi:hypothetical protein
MRCWLLLAAASLFGYATGQRMRRQHDRLKAAGLIAT